MRDDDAPDFVPMIFHHGLPATVTFCTLYVPDVASLVCGAPGFLKMLMRLRMVSASAWRSAKSASRWK